MSKHTPGPWRFSIDDTGGEFTGWPSVDAAEELDTTIVHRAGFHQRHWNWHPGLPETLANARLIAAAPDLLAALKGLMEGNLPPSGRIGSPRVWNQVCIPSDEALNAAQAAIDAAERDEE